MSAMVRCPLCHMAVEVEVLGAHLDRHSTLAIMCHSFRTWPAWTAAVVIGAITLVVVLYAAISQVMP